MAIDANSFIRVFSLATISFLLAILLTPILAHFLYKYNISKRLRTHSWDGDKAVEFQKMHRPKAGTPTMGGVLIWVTVGIVTFFLNLSRSQTYLPLFAMISSGVLGATDDFFNAKGKSIIAGLSAKIKFFFQFLIAGLGGWWFFYKLDYSEIRVPAHQIFHLPAMIDVGGLYFPIFVLTVVFLANAVNITDGLDGLAGGTLAVSFGAITGIALLQNQLGIAAFGGTVVGALLAFLWFNIFPARFFLGDTGAFALGATLAVLAFLTDSFLLLPLIAFIFVIEACSSLLQLGWKRYLKRKLFRIAPLHHHLEAIGWPESKVTMRLWVIAAVTATVGMIIALI